MAISLITCLGARDPFDKSFSNFYGSLLSSCIYIKEKHKSIDNINIFITKEFEYKKEEIENQIKKIDCNANIKFLNTELDDPSNLDSVNLSFRNLLRPINREFKEKETYVNLSSGTQQMTQTLTLMLISGFIRGIGLSVKNPLYYDLDNQIDNSQLSEPKQNVLNRVNAVKINEIPGFKYISINNLITLVQSNSFNQAKELLKKIPQNELSQNILMRLLQIAINLLNLDITNAKDEFKLFQKAYESFPFKNDYLEKVDNLKTSLNCQIDLLYYWICKIYDMQGNFEAFIKGVGLLRERSLDRNLNEQNFKPIIEFLCTNGELDLKKIHNNKDKLKLEKADSINIIVKLRIAEYAASRDTSLLATVSIFQNTESIISIRNNYSHQISKISEDDITTARQCLEKLADIMPGYKKNNLNGSVFKIIRELFKDIIKYWYD